MGRWEGGERAQIRLTKFTKDCPRAPSCMATHIPKPRTSETLPHPPLRPLAQAPILTAERFPKGPSGWARGEQIPALFAGLRMAAPTGGGWWRLVEKGLFFHKLSTSVNMRESDQTEGGGVISMRVGGDGGKERAPGEKKFFLKFIFFHGKAEIAPCTLTSQLHVTAT